MHDWIIVVAVNLPAQPLAASSTNSFALSVRRGGSVSTAAASTCACQLPPRPPPLPPPCPNTYPSLQCAHPHTAQSTSSMCIAGERPQRAKHLWRWMYYKDHWVRDLEETHGKQYGFGADFRCSISHQADTIAHDIHLCICRRLLPGSISCSHASCLGSCNSYWCIQ